MKIGEFFVDLLVDAQSGNISVKQLASSFGDLELATLGELAAIVAVITKLAQMADQAMETAVAFQRFETATGLSSQELQRWQIVAAQANVSAEAVSGSVTALQRQLAAIRLGQGNIAPFQILGIGANQDAFAVLEQLRNRLKSVNAATATNIISQMGLDPSMLQVLRLTNDQFGQFLATAKGLGGPEAQVFLKMRLALTQLELQLRDLGLMVVSSLATPIVHMFEDLSFLVGKTVGGVRFLVENFTALGNVFKWLLLFNPFSAMLLALDDVITYFRGGNSLVGLAIDGFKKLFGAIEDEVRRVAPMLTSVAGTALKLASVGAMFAPLVAPAFSAAGAATTSVMQSNTLSQTIHSSAPAEDVARHAVGEHKRQINAASLLINNGEK